VTDPLCAARQARPVLTAGFRIRAVAQGVDLAASTLVGFGVEGLWSLTPLARAPAVARDEGAAFLIDLVIGLMGGALSSTLAEGIGGATLGKALLGLRVRRVDLRPCTLSAALRRAIAYWVDSFVFGLVAYQTMVRSPINQRLGDKWAGTVVVVRRSMPAGMDRHVALGVALGLLVEAATVVVSVVARVL
jgi:uncharacterized RDD family membrane protein YckC